MVDFFFISALSCVLKCNDLNHFKCAARWHQMCSPACPVVSGLRRVHLLSPLDTACPRAPPPLSLCVALLRGPRVRGALGSVLSGRPLPLRMTSSGSARVVAGAGRAAFEGRLRSWEWMGRLARPLTHTGHSGSIRRLAAVNCAAGTTGDGSLLPVLPGTDPEVDLRTLVPVCAVSWGTAGPLASAAAPFHLRTGQRAGLGPDAHVRTRDTRTSLTSRAPVGTSRLVRVCGPRRAVPS